MGKFNVWAVTHKGVYHESEICSSEKRKVIAEIDLVHWILILTDRYLDGILKICPN